MFGRCFAKFDRFEASFGRIWSTSGQIWSKCSQLGPNLAEPEGFTNKWLRGNGKFEQKLRRHRSGTKASWVGGRTKQPSASLEQGAADNTPYTAPPTTRRRRRDQGAAPRRQRQGNPKALADLLLTPSEQLEGSKQKNKCPTVSCKRADERIGSPRSPTIPHNCFYLYSSPNDSAQVLSMFSCGCQFVLVAFSVQVHQKYGSFASGPGPGRSTTSASVRRSARCHEYLCNGTKHGLASTTRGVVSTRSASLAQVWTCLET